MNSQGELEQAIRAGTFSTLATADQVVERLLAAKFTKDEITVVCSNETIESHFQNYRHQEPAGDQASPAVAAGVSIGAFVGGLTAIAVGAATGTVPLLIAGAAGLSAGSAAGGYLGAMLTRGGEKELSNYYDQEIRNGKILVAVEVHGPAAAARLARAAAVIAEAGADPVRLPEG